MLTNYGCMVVAEDLQCLKSIALMGGMDGPVSISTQKLGTELGISPQTASRRLISLEGQGLIARTIRPDGQFVTITGTGEEELRNEYAAYQRIFEEGERAYQLEGELISGLGEGRYYVSIAGYVNQFRERLGIDPFPGTFNVRLSAASVETRRKLAGLDWIAIEGFTDHDRTFGGAKGLHCTIEGYDCAIIVPGRSHYPDDIIEIISGTGLRTALDLKDGDKVTIEVKRE